MEEEKKRKREIIILKLTIVILAAALLVQVLFGREGLLRKSSEVIRAVSIEKAANDRGPTVFMSKEILFGSIRIRSL